MHYKHLHVQQVFLLDIANEFISNSEGSKLLDVLNFDYCFFQYLFVLVGVVN